MLCDPQAGVAGLLLLNELVVPAAAVSHASAQIGDGADGGLQTLLVTADGATLLSLVDAPAQDFLHYSLSFVASSGSTLLSFVHGDAPSFFILDDVSVRSVPEPGALGLLGLGLVSLGLVRRRRTACSEIETKARREIAGLFLFQDGANSALNTPYGAARSAYLKVPCSLISRAASCNAP